MGTSIGLLNDDGPIPSPPTPHYFGAWRREGQESPCFLALSGGADGVRASEAHHAVERLDRDLGFDLLGRPGLGAQRVADHTLVSAHRRLHARTLEHLKTQGCWTRSHASGRVICWPWPVGLRRCL